MDAQKSAGEPWLSALRVFLVGDVVEPGDDLTLLVRLLHCDVGHEPVGSRAVPVLFAGLDVDDVAGPNLLDLAAATCDEADAVGDVQRLASRVRVPGGTRTWSKPDVGAADRGLFVGVADAVDVDGAAEPVLRADGGLSAALGELHVRVLLSLVTGAAAL